MTKLLCETGVGVQVRSEKRSKLIGRSRREKGTLQLLSANTSDQPLRGF